MEPEAEDFLPAFLKIVAKVEGDIAEHFYPKMGGPEKWQKQPTQGMSQDCMARTVLIASDVSGGDSLSPVETKVTSAVRKRCLDLGLNVVEVTNSTPTVATHLVAYVGRRSATAPKDEVGRRLLASVEDQLQKAHPHISLAPDVRVMTTDWVARRACRTEGPASGLLHRRALPRLGVERRDQDEPLLTEMPADCEGLYHAKYAISTSSKRARPGVDHPLPGHDVPEAHPAHMVNARLADALDELSELYRLAQIDAQDCYRARAFGTIARAMRRWSKPIHREEDLAELVRFRTEQHRGLDPGWGEQTIGAVRQMLAKMEAMPGASPHDCLDRLVQRLANEEIRTRLLFGRIWGVGSAIAAEWWRRGYRTYDDVYRAGAAVGNIKVGLDLREDFEERIPRSEVELIAGHVRDAVCFVLRERLPGSEQTVTCEPVGSYRRGKSTSGDVDVIICPMSESMARNDHVADGLLREVVQHLMEHQGLVTHVLSAPKQVGAKQSFMGVFRLKEQNARYRRLDMKVYPPEMLPTALLYFTGSETTNRSMRLYAKKRMQLHLSDEGLFRSRDRPRERIHCASEADVFAHLKLRYLRPEDRTGPVVPLEHESGFHGASDSEEGAEDKARSDDGVVELKAERALCKKLLDVSQGEPRNPRPGASRNADTEPQGSPQA